MFVVISKYLGCVFLSLLQLPLEELTSVLLRAVEGDSSRFGDVANQYRSEPLLKQLVMNEIVGSSKFDVMLALLCRPQCFENQYFDYLTNIINSTQDNDKKLVYLPLLLLDCVSICICLLLILTLIVWHAGKHLND